MDNIRSSLLTKPMTEAFLEITSALDTENPTTKMNPDTDNEDTIKIYITIHDTQYSHPFIIDAVVTINDEKVVKGKCITDNSNPKGLTGLDLKIVGSIKEEGDKFTIKLEITREGNAVMKIRGTLASSSTDHADKIMIITRKEKNSVIRIGNTIANSTVAQVDIIDIEREVEDISNSAFKESLNSEFEDASGSALKDLGDIGWKDLLGLGSENILDSDLINSLNQDSRDPLDSECTDLPDLLPEGSPRLLFLQNMQYTQPNSDAIIGLNRGLISRHNNELPASFSGVSSNITGCTMLGSEDDGTNSPLRWGAQDMVFFPPLEPGISAYTQGMSSPLERPGKSPGAAFSPDLSQIPIMSESQYMNFHQDWPPSDPSKPEKSVCVEPRSASKRPRVDDDDDDDDDISHAKRSKGSGVTHESQIALVEYSVRGTREDSSPAQNQGVASAESPTQIQPMDIALSSPEARRKPEDSSPAQNQDVASAESPTQIQPMDIALSSPEAKRKPEDSSPAQNQDVASAESPTQIQPMDIALSSPEAKRKPEDSSGSPCELRLIFQCVPVEEHIQKEDLLFREFRSFSKCELYIDICQYIGIDPLKCNKEYTTAVLNIVKNMASLPKDIAQSIHCKDKFSVIIQQITLLSQIVNDQNICFINLQPEDQIFFNELYMFANNIHSFLRNFGRKSISFDEFTFSTLSLQGIAVEVKIRCVLEQYFLPIVLEKILSAYSKGQEELHQTIVGRSTIEILFKKIYHQVGRGGFIIKGRQKQWLKFFQRCIEDFNENILDNSPQTRPEPQPIPMNHDVCGTQEAKSAGMQGLFCEGEKGLELAEKRGDSIAKMKCKLEKKRVLAAHKKNEDIRRTRQKKVLAGVYKKSDIDTALSSSVRNANIAEHQRIMESLSMRCSVNATDNIVYITICSFYKIHPLKLLQNYSALPEERVNALDKIKTIMIMKHCIIAIIKFLNDQPINTSVQARELEGISSFAETVKLLSRIVLIVQYRSYYHAISTDHMLPLLMFLATEYLIPIVLREILTVCPVGMEQFTRNIIDNMTIGQLLQHMFTIISQRGEHPPWKKVEKYIKAYKTSSVLNKENPELKTDELLENYIKNYYKSDYCMIPTKEVILDNILIQLTAIKEEFRKLHKEHLKINEGNPQEKDIEVFLLVYRSVLRKIASLRYTVEYPEDQNIAKAEENLRILQDTIRVQFIPLLINQIFDQYHENKKKISQETRLDIKGRSIFKARTEALSSPSTQFSAVNSSLDVGSQEDDAAIVLVPPVTLPLVDYALCSSQD